MGQGGGNGGVAGVGWGNVWSNVGRSAWVAAVVVGQKSSRAGEGRGEQGGREWAVTHPGNGESRRDLRSLLLLIIVLR